MANVDLVYYEGENSGYAIVIHESDNKADLIVLHENDGDHTYHFKVPYAAEGGGHTFRDRK